MCDWGMRAPGWQRLTVGYIVIAADYLCLELPMLVCRGLPSLSAGHLCLPRAIYICSEWSLFSVGYVSLQVAAWEAKAEIQCLASCREGLFVATPTGYALLGHGWSTVRRPQQLPLGLADVDAQHVTVSGLLKHFAVADLLNESQDQVRGDPPPMRMYMHAVCWQIHRNACKLQRHSLR